MKTFEEIYQELQNENNSELNNSWELAKQKSKKAKKIAIICCIIINLLCIIKLSKGLTFVNVNWRFIPLLILYWLVINIILYFMISIIIQGSKEHRNYNKVYKELVIKKLMNNFFHQLEYFPTKSMPEYIYQEANYKEDYDSYESEDYIEGYINDKYSIQMAEILTEEEEEYTDSDGEEHTRMVTKFNGLFAKIIMHKSINGEFRVAQNRTIYSKNKLEMDSSEFEKYFDVETSDKIKGMQILTADVMEELIAFQKNTNVEYDIFIKDNELYLRFHCGEMFETGKLKDGPIDRETIKKYFYMLNFTYNLSNKLIDVINEVMI